MRIILAASIIAFSLSSAGAQTTQQKDVSEHSTGRTSVPDEKGVSQPQGPTGPINTGTGGAPASSPQGETPPGMQAAPDGSSKSIVEPAK